MKSILIGFAVFVVATFAVAAMMLALASFLGVSLDQGDRRFLLVVVVAVSAVVGVAVGAASDMREFHKQMRGPG